MKTEGTSAATEFESKKPFYQTPHEQSGPDGHVLILQQENPKKPDSTSEPITDLDFDPNDPYHIRFDYEIYEQLYDVEFDYSEKYKKIEDELFSDGDLVKNAEFLEKISTLTTVQRITLLTQSARKVYSSSDDFQLYFERFPDDAKSVIATCLDKIELGHMPDYTIYQLSCKVFEGAAKTIPGYWEAFQAIVDKKHHSTVENQWPNYLAVSARSKRARDHLLGDYKTLPSARFESAGAAIQKVFGDFIDRTEDIVNHQDWGYVEFGHEVLSHPSYQQLSNKEKTDFLKNVIIYCHNALVFHEVYNSAFNERHSVAKPDEVTIGLSNRGKYQTRMIGRGFHSIIYNTDHKEHSFQAHEYNQFEANTWTQERPVDECGYEKIIEAAIRELGNVGVSSEVELIMEFWDKNRDPAYGPAISQAISTLDVREGATQIFRRMPEAKELDRRRYLSLLFRLELGKVDISEHGLEYLGRRFDLGEHNKPDYFAHRLTPDGKVGVFDEGRHLQGLVQMEAGDFEVLHDVAIQKQVIDISYEILFTPHPDESEAEREQREGILENFKVKYFDTYINLFGIESSLRFNNLELPEQGWVLQYLQGADPASREVFFSFMAIFGEKGFKAFRAMEFGGIQMVADLIRFADKIDRLDLVLDELSAIYEDLPDIAVSLIDRGFSLYEIDKIVENSSKIASNIVMAAIEIAKRDDDRSVIYQGLGGEPYELVSFENSEYGTDISIYDLNYLHRFMSDLHSDNDEEFYWAFGQLLFHESVSFNAVNEIDLNEHLADASNRERLTAAGFNLEKLSDDPLYEYRLKEFIYRQIHDPGFMAESEISQRLKNLYEKPIEEFNLRDYEDRTTSTPAMLRAMKKAMFDHVHSVRRQLGDKDFEINTFLDECGGGGRSGIPFRYVTAIGGDGSKCIEVNAFDISPSMVKRSYDRVAEDEETRELYRMTQDAGFPVRGRESDHGRYTQVEGNFMTFGLADYKKAFPESKKPQVINIGWHSFTFAGSSENQLKVLRNAYEMLEDYGVLYIEIPDRSFGSYRAELLKYHRDHPETPYGTLVDAPSKQEGAASEQDSSIATPRYFPSVQEVQNLARYAGFTMRSYPRTYFVTHASEDGTEIPVIKENLIELIKIPQYENEPEEQSYSHPRGGFAQMSAKADDLSNKR